MNTDQVITLACVLIIGMAIGAVLAEIVMAGPLKRLTDENTRLRDALKLAAKNDARDPRTGRYVVNT